jgi:hypothetical protein
MPRTRKLHPAIEAALAAQIETLPIDDVEPGDLEIETDDDAEQAADETRVRSVVKPGYKAHYRAKADAMQRRPKAIPLKALRRTTGDWLGLELAKLVLDPKAKLIVSKLEAILDANGVKHSHWNRTTKGWQGRLRMTGRLALERIVAAEGALLVPDAAAIPAPRSWVAAHQH